MSNFCFDRICINFSVFLFVIPQCLLLFFLSLFVTFSSISGASQHVPLTFYSACSLVKSHIYVTNIGYNFICFNHYLNAKNMAFRTLTILVFLLLFFTLIWVSPHTIILIARALFCLFVLAAILFFLLLRRSLNEFSPRVGVDRPEPELPARRAKRRSPLSGGRPGSLKLMLLLSNFCFVFVCCGETEYYSITIVLF